MRVLLALLFLLIPTLSQAGAWPREAGQGFLTVATRLGWPQDVTQWTSVQPTSQYHTLYIEFGMTDRLTVGLDFGRAVSGGAKLVGFAQLPLLDRDTGPKVAAQLGFGSISGDSVMRPGLMIGWGMPQAFVTMDAVAEVYRNGDRDLKLDFTWGRKLPKDRMLLLQLQTGIEENDPPFARFAPSLVFPVRNRMKAEVGGTIGLHGDDSMGVKIGLWLDF